MWFVGGVQLAFAAQGNPILHGAALVDFTLDVPVVDPVFNEQLGGVTLLDRAGGIERPGDESCGVHVGGESGIVAVHCRRKKRFHASSQYLSPPCLCVLVPAAPPLFASLEFVF